MIQSYLQTIGKSVYTQEAQRLGKVMNVVVAPESGKVLGFQLAPFGQKVITPVDILSWKDELVVHDADSILDIQDVIKIEESLKTSVTLLRNKVVTKKGVFLGKVNDYFIDPKMMMLVKLAVSKSILGFFRYEHKLIDARNILEIKKNVIIVKDTNEAKEKAATHTKAKRKKSTNLAPSPAMTSKN